MFTIKIEFVHKMHYFKEQCETEERWRAQLSVSAVIAKMHGIADLARVRWRFAQQILPTLPKLVCYAMVIISCKGEIM